MTSVALIDWNAQRAQRIALAWGVHTTLAAPPQIAWHSDQALAIIVQRLSTEFQGFTRALHDEAVDVFVNQVAGANLALEAILRERMTAERSLSKGNPTKKALGSDFGRLGFTFWAAMQQANGRANAWSAELDKLIEMRNGVAHDDTAKLSRLASEGYPLSVGTLRNWQKTLGDIAATMDVVVASSLSAVLIIPRPW
ncbi:hypothetical protein ACF07U_06985 [Streptomyces californicus]|uniref:hypothetical protein n=1 Tax=Streptomyces californicus TaxID=67351 RepID=UPI0036FC6AFA